MTTRLAAVAAIGLVAGSVIAGARFARPASASPGAFNDPQDAFDDGAGSPPIDIRRITHDDTTDAANPEIIYTFEAWNDFADFGTNEVRFLLDFGSDPTAQDADLEVGAGTPRGFYCHGPADAQAQPVTFTRKATGSATSTPSNSFEVRFPRSYLTRCGAGSTYHYFVLTAEDSTQAGANDDAPDGSNGGGSSPPPRYTHTLSPLQAPTTTTTAAPTTTTAPPTTQTVGSITPSVLAPGQQAAIAGGGFAANALLQPTVFSTPVQLGTFKSDASGNYSATVTIPADTAPGNHQIVVSGPGANGGMNNSVASFTVSAQSPVAQAVTATANFTG